MSKYKVVLVVPNFRWLEVEGQFLWHYLPYNLCMLAAVIRDQCEVVVLDSYSANMSPKAFAEEIKILKPDLVGITVLMDQCAPAGHQAARIVKESAPGARVVMGGVYATINPEKAMADQNVDYVLIGEGEEVLPELILHCAEDGPFPAVGICRRTERDGVVIAKPAPFIEDLDQLPLPAYDLIDFSRYASDASRASVDGPSLFPYGRVLTSRGCPQNCVFCQVQHISGRKFRARSVKNILSEIAWLRDTYNIRALLFDDDNLLADRKRARELFTGMIKAGLTMPWKAIATAVFMLDYELLDLMRESGCEYIDVAIESGCERVLYEVINKPVDLNRAAEMINYARKIGIFVAANFIIGFPTETWAEIRQSLQVAESLNADYTKIFAAIPLYRTRLWEVAKERGMLLENTSTNWNCGQICSSEFSPEDLTILRAYEWDRINFATPEKCASIAAMMQISEEALEQTRRKTRDRIASLMRTSS